MRSSCDSATARRVPQAARHPSPCLVLRRFIDQLPMTHILQSRTAWQRQCSTRPRRRERSVAVRAFWRNLIPSAPRNQSGLVEKKAYARSVDVGGLQCSPMGLGTWSFGNKFLWVRFELPAPAAGDHIMLHGARSWIAPVVWFGDRALPPFTQGHDVHYRAMTRAWTRSCSRSSTWWSARASTCSTRQTATARAP